MVMTYTRLLLHGLSYYLSWVVCLYFASIEKPWTGPLLVVLFLVIQATWEKANGFGLRRQLYFTLSIGLLGTVADSLWLIFHLIAYKANPWGPWLAAPWIISLWLSFGFNLIVLYEKTFVYYKTWSMLAFLGVPFSYWLGVKIGAASPLSAYFYIILGCFWALTLPLLLVVYND